ncbi:hypothetical protein [Endozoicomonas sp. 8E]|uniref:hypothetical protein n=1 Tax=Endozoicomonas sp. 8E TaxID=3035692 RepID=UPI0029391E9A|nr:hypothetical protein [Endozoicomonas sp. 8E]WOG26933.1 hypothetical protein P6910_20645 [Endozoicomonas sp. 8E]
MKKRFVVELKQNKDSTNPGFSVKRDLGISQNRPSDIAETNGYAEPDLSVDN